MLEEHDSSVRCLNILHSKNKKYLISAGGKEELIIWEIFKKKKLFLKLNLSTTTKNNIFYEMKLSSRSNEYRILSLESMILNENQILIITGSSDSLIKFFVYFVGKNEILTIAYSNFHEGNVNQLLIRDSKTLISAGTEGNISIFDIEFIHQKEFHLIEPIAHFKAHKSVITSISSNEHFLATGGDDQSINFFHLFDLTKIESNSHQNQHFTQITGIYLNENFLISTGIDQKLNIYSFKKLILKLEKSILLDITNILNMIVLERKEDFLIIVIGSGIQLLKISKNLFNK